MSAPAAGAGQPAGAEGSAPALTLAGIAALLATGCCVMPLVLAIVGISGAWIGHLTRMEPYSGALTGTAVVALLFAAWRIYRPLPQDAQCEPGGSCAVTRAASRRWFWALAALTLLPVVVRLGAPLFY